MNNETLLQPPEHKREPYYSYLLRLWGTGICKPEFWRASLEDPRTGERIGFANLEELFAFLIQQVESPGSGQI